MAMYELKARWKKESGMQACRPFVSVYTTSFVAAVAVTNHDDASLKGVSVFQSRSTGQPFPQTRSHDQRDST